MFNIESCFKSIYKNEKGELFQMLIQPFTIAVPQSILSDVRKRLAHTLVFGESFSLEEMT
jgi:hypothetical protein